MTDRDRPTSLTALAVGAICLGLLGVFGTALGAIVILGIGAALVAWDSAPSPTAVATFVTLSVLSIGSVLYLAFGLGALTSNQAAWRFGICGASMSLVAVAIALWTGVIGANVTAMILVAFAGAMLYGLLRSPAIRAWFGRD